MKKGYILMGIGIAMTVVALFFMTMTIVFGKKMAYENAYDNTIDDIMADEVEIERKWLIDKDNIPYDMSNAEVWEIEQTYISFSPEFRVRRINDGLTYTCAFKANLTEDGLIRDEIETDITKEEYETLIAKGEGNTILKTRYQFLDEEGYLIAIDIFSGDLEGLAYMEIEFVNPDEAEAYGNPDWVIEDVTDDINYKNGYLARYGIPDSFYEKRRQAGLE